MFEAATTGDTSPTPPTLALDRDGTVRAQGAWDLAGIETHGRPSLADPQAAQRIDITGIERLDTAGAIALLAVRDTLARDRALPEIEGPAGRMKLIEAVDRADCPPAPSRQERWLTLILTERVGRWTMSALGELSALLGFLGLVTLSTWRSLFQPGSIRGTALAAHIEQTGMNALGIVGLLSFLIGVVVAYQGADVLRQFGAETLVVELLGISILREMGILMTAIIVAGRSGSAFTAQIGAMVAGQEVDAMRTMGLDPVRFLVVPRVLALLITLPLLTFFANFMALLGGAIMAWLVLDLSLASFVIGFQERVPVNNLWVGLIKAPVFAFIIALVGCYQGFQVEGSAASVGRRVTVSVVEAIFFVITFDALFSIFFSIIGV